MVEVTDAELLEAKRRWEVERAGRPIPASVRFDAVSERVIVEFTNGASFLFPARAVEGLQDASPHQLTDVELLGETGLHWESLDVDYTIAGLMNGIFGTRAFMESRYREALRRGGQSRSEAKIAASRANGAKGGRPKKTDAGS
jgi:hypothetical protein